MVIVVYKSFIAYKTCVKIRHFGKIKRLCQNSKWRPFQAYRLYLVKNSLFSKKRYRVNKSVKELFAIAHFEKINAKNLMSEKEL